MCFMQGAAVMVISPNHFLLPRGKKKKKRCWINYHLTNHSDTSLKLCLLLHMSHKNKHVHYGLPLPYRTNADATSVS